MKYSKERNKIENLDYLDKLLLIHHLRMENLKINIKYIEDYLNVQLFK